MKLKADIYMWRTTSSFIFIPIQNKKQSVEAIDAASPGWSKFLITLPLGIYLQHQTLM